MPSLVPFLMEAASLPVTEATRALACLEMPLGCAGYIHTAGGLPICHNRSYGIVQRRGSRPEDCSKCSKQRAMLSGSFCTLNDFLSTRLCTLTDFLSTHCALPCRSCRLRLFSAALISTSLEPLVWMALPCSSQHSVFSSDHTPSLPLPYCS